MAYRTVPNPGGGVAEVFDSPRALVEGFESSLMGRALSGAESG